MKTKTLRKCSKETQVHEAMECLEKANILSLDYPVTSTDAPAIPSLTRSPKLIMLDSGITNFVCRFIMWDS